MHLSTSAPAPRRGGTKGPALPPTGLAVHRLRADIQGLRAVAVLSVLLFHAGLPWLPGGYVGVDVFFVISGFLITGLLIKELSRTGRISLRDFYVRRVRRILPAALVVIVLTLAAGRLALPLSQWESLGWTGLWAALSVANWSLAVDSTDYFNAEAAPSPLQHYWSLGVEEQYYLLWPLLLIAVIGVSLRRRLSSVPSTPGRAASDVRGDEASPPAPSVSPSSTAPAAAAAPQADDADRATVLDPRAVAVRVLVLAGLVGLVSFVHSVLFTPQNQGAAYFVTTTRVWELAVGAGLSALVVLLPALSTVLRIVLGWAGLGMVVAAVLLFTDATVFPGYAAALPVLGSALMILAGTHAVDDRHGAGAGALLATGPARWIGDLSYSLYLVHWPLIAIVSWQFADGLPLWLGLVLAAASVPLAWLLRIAVELPFMGSPAAAAAPTPAQTREEARRRRRRSSVRPLLAGGVATAAVSALALALALTAAERTALGPADASVAGAGAAGGEESATAADEPTGPPEDWDPVGELANLTVDEIVPAPSAAFQDGSPLVHRDCHTKAADDTAKRCEDGDPNSDTTVLIVGDSHIHHWSEAVVTAALERDWHVVSYAKGACPITTNTVELSAEDGGPRPFTECTRWNENVMEEIVAEQADILITSTSHHLDEDGTSAADGMAEAWRQLVDNAGHVVALADPPHAEQPVAQCVERNADDIAACTWDRAEGLEKSGTPDILAAAEEVPEVEVIDLTDFICPGDTCSPVVGNALVFTDTNHMTATFSRSLSGALGERLDDIIAE